ncbi:hypothetical protein PPACK8108_LOCUS20290, partial [Phakopsora pachyrhizi]
IGAFETEEEGEIGLSKGNVVEVIQEEKNGWWLIKNSNKQGWKPVSRPAAPPATSQTGSKISPPQPLPPPVSGLVGMKQTKLSQGGLVGLGFRSGEAKRAAAAASAGQQQTNKSSENSSRSHSPANNVTVDCSDNATENNRCVVFVLLSELVSLFSLFIFQKIK